MDVTPQVSEEIEEVEESTDRRTQMAYVLMGLFVVLIGLGAGIALGFVLGVGFGIGAAFTIWGLCAGIVGKLLGEE